MKEFFNRYIHYNIPFYVLAGISALMLIISWIMPPPWEVHSSVITAVAELFAFAALWTVIIAIENGGTAKITKGDVNLEIKQENKNQEQE